MYTDNSFFLYDLSKGRREEIEREISHLHLEVKLALRSNLFFLRMLYNLSFVNYLFSLVHIYI